MRMFMSLLKASVFTVAYMCLHGVSTKIGLEARFAFEQVGLTFADASSTLRV